MVSHGFVVVSIFVTCLVASLFRYYEKNSQSRIDITRK
jgi:hypothetical protein